MDRENIELIRNSEYTRPDKLPYVTFYNKAVHDKHLSLQTGNAEYRNVILANVCAYGETKCIVPKEVKSWKLLTRTRKVTKNFTVTVAVEKFDEKTGKPYFEDEERTERRTVDEPEFVYEDTYPWFEFLDQQINAQKDPLEAERLRNWKGAIVRKYEEWLKTGEVPVDGTPLIEWRGIDESIKQRFIEMGINTVERLAEAGEEAIQQIMGGRDAKNKAANFIDAHRDANQAAAMVSSLQNQLDAQAQRAAELQSDYEKKIQELEARIQQQAEGDQPKKRGRPPKVA